MSHSEQSAPPLSPKDEVLKAYLAERTRAGDRYFKSKYVADEIELTSNEIGASMVKLRSAVTSLDIEKWTTNSPATWRVTPVRQSASPDQQPSRS